VTLGIGIIGCGIHGGRYLKHAAQDVEGLQPVAVNRRDPQAGADLAAQWDCRYHQDVQDLIDDPDVQGVIITTPPSTHFPYARAVLEAGKPLLLEKPMTGTLAEAKQLAVLAALPGAPPVMIAQTLRWNPVLLKLRDLLPRIGRIHMVRIVQRLEPTTLAWQRDASETVGGSVLLTGVHLFDTVRWLTGAEFSEVDSRQEAILNPVVEDFFLARARMTGGCHVSMEVSKYTRSRVCLIEIVGEEGQLLADYYFGGLRLIVGAQETRFEVAANTPTLPLVLAAWYDAVQNNKKPPVTLTDGLKTLEMVKACYESANLFQPVKVSE
jgi:predicted dehydrogenase